MFWLWQLQLQNWLCIHLERWYQTELSAQWSREDSKVWNQAIRTHLHSQFISLHFRSFTDFTTGHFQAFKHYKPREIGIVVAHIGFQVRDNMTNPAPCSWNTHNISLFLSSLFSFWFLSISRSLRADIPQSTFCKMPIILLTFSLVCSMLNSRTAGSLHLIYDTCHSGVRGKCHTGHFTHDKCTDLEMQNQAVWVTKMSCFINILGSYPSDQHFSF